jgi:GT2 family glycosyltransferase
MDASVIVVNWRQPDLTARCLESLARQRADASWEIVLVENEALPGAVDRFRRLVPDLVVVEEPTNAGFAGGVARGLRAARGDVVVLLNNDAVAEPGFVEEGLRALRDADPRVAAASATVVLAGTFSPASRRGDSVLVGLDGRLWERDDDPSAVVLLNGTGIELDRDGNGWDRDWLAPATPVPPRAEPPFGFSGGAAFVRRDALDEVGGFDESLFMYYEDLDVSWRLRLAGRDVVHAPAARTVHLHAGSSSSSGSLVRRQSMRNRVLVVVRNGSRALVLRVVVRTAGRLVLDLARPARAQLSPREWASLVPDLVRSVPRAWAARRRSGVTETARRAVESSLPRSAR